MTDLYKKTLNILPLIIIISGVFVSYLPTLSGDFLLDDKIYIKDNPYIHSFHSIFSYLSQEDGAVNDEFSEFHTGYYRPLINFSYNIDYKMWGMDAFGFRMTNLIFHIITCLMLYMTLKLISDFKMASLIVVLFFGLHPANTESVSWIASRNNILVTFFGLASIYGYIKSKMMNKVYPYITSLISFTASLLCKEFGIMLLPIIFFYNRFFNKRIMTLKNEILRYIPYMIIAILYIFLRSLATDTVVNAPVASDLGRALYFSPFLVLYNLRIIFLPYSLHNFIVPYPDNFFSKEAFYGFISILFFGYLLWRYRNNKKLLFSSFSFIISLFPVLHIIPTSAVSIVSLRWIYFPMSWLCFYGVFLIGKWLKSKYRVLCIIFTVSVVLYFGLYTYFLNRDFWQSDETLFKSEVFSFGNAFYLDDLALFYHTKGEYEKAYSCYKTAINHASNNKLYHNMGVLLVEMNRPDEALSYLVRIDKKRLKREKLGEYYSTMGAAYLKKGDFLDSIRFFTYAMEAEPNVGSRYLNLGIALRKAGQFRDSIVNLEKGMDLGGDPLRLRKELSIAYMAVKDYHNAIKILEEIPMEIRNRDPVIQKRVKRAYQRILDGK